MGDRSVPRRVLAALCAAVCLSATGCDAIAGRTHTFKPVRDPLIAVLGQAPPRVDLLDARTLEVLQSVRLRSQALGMTVVGDSVVTAQCGDLGGSSDTKVGILRPFSGSIDYRDLGVLDPEEVWASGEGWCVALHGLVDSSGMKCSRIDLRSGKGEVLSIPPAGQAGAGTRDTVWILQQSVSGPDDLVTEDFYVFKASGEPKVIASDTTATVDVCGFDDAVITVARASGGTRLVRRDAVTGRVIAERTHPGITSAPGCAWAAGDVLVLADHAGSDDGEAREVVIVDPVTLEAGPRVPVDGVSAAGPAGNDRFVVCEIDGDVVVFRSSDGEMLCGTRLEGRPGELVEVVYSVPAGHKVVE